MLDENWPAADVLLELTDNFISVVVLQRLPDGSNEIRFANALPYYYFDHLK